MVDLESGLLLSVSHSVPYSTQSYLDAVAAAAVEMFRGKNVTAVEKLLSSTRGKPVVNSLEEIQMSTQHTYHFMKVLPNKKNYLLVLITGKKANLGMGWVAVRSRTDDIEAFCP